MDRDEAMRLLKGGPVGVAEWNRRREAGEKIPDLAKADLSLNDLIGARLSLADLIGAHLGLADLNLADLRGAHLFGARLGGADLRGARLDGANLNGAMCRGTIFADVVHMVEEALGVADVTYTERDVEYELAI